MLLVLHDVYVIGEVEMNLIEAIRDLDFHFKRHMGKWPRNRCCSSVFAMQKRSDGTLHQYLKHFSSKGLKVFLGSKVLCVLF